METLLGPMVQVVLDKVYTAMSNRAQVIANFEDQFEQLKKGLTTTNDLLAKAMDLQSKYDEVVGALSQLREVIDEADDVLTDCLVRDTYKENKSSLRFWFHDPGFKLRVGKQLKDINTKMDEARNTLGEHLKIANSTAPDRTHNGESHENQSESTWEFMSRNYDPDVTYGLVNYIKSLKEWMLGSTKGKLDFAGIVGMGGLGKTTIAMKFFNDPEVVSHFDKMIWVPVSRNFSAQRILKCMLEKANLQAPDVWESDNMFTSLKQGLKDQAYLIVMDDVWHNPNLYIFWTNLRDSLPKTVKKSSCIIITTRNIEVADRLVDQDSLKLQPDTLNEEDSWALFSRVAFQSTEVTELFKEAGRAIVNKCGGLPLGIKTVGGYLAKESLFKWTETIEKFHSLAINEETESLMLCLQVSYDELPTEMKQCLLCLSVYPEDVEIHADQLVHWWFVEGLIRSKKGNSKTALELGYEYLAKLANRCLLEVAETRGYDGRIYKFKIHDMIRELIIRIAEKEKFCNFNEECRQIQIEDSRWLCLTEDMAAEVETLWIKSKSSNSKLRALLLMSSPSMIDFTKKFVLLESLRVLDFSYSKLDVIIVKDSSTASSGIRVEKLFDMITSLKRLACLNLSGVQKLLEVPSSIEKLLNLQVLVLNGCINLGKIHAKITSLKRLVVLDIGTCPLQHLPRDLGRLSDLQELSGLRVVSRAETWGCTLLQLGRLKQLRVLRITIVNVAEISEEEKKSLSSLQNLKVLAIDAADTNKQENLEMIDELELPPKIEELYLRNYRSRKMPNWFSPLRLPKLHYLSIEDCDVESLKDNCSWKIEGLYLKLLEMLKVDWIDLKRVMPALRYMEISKCSNLTNFPVDVVKKAVWRKCGSITGRKNHHGSNF